MEIDITVWVCPTCGNYYAAKSAGDLRTAFNIQRNSKNEEIARIPRSRCPDCRSRGQEVDRLPVLATVVV